MSFPFDRFMADWRATRHKDGARITQAELDLVRAAIEGRYVPPSLATSGAGDPRWMAHARSKLGQREIKGPKHNSWIAKGWARLGAGWFNDDETPWCGFFVADALDAAGLPYPKNFPAAASFRTYGVAVPAQLGAIATMRRPGGNHVFFIAGETPDRQSFKALGGNQSDAVTIMDVAKRQVDAIRWPPGVPVVPRAEIRLPILAAGTILRSMA